MQRCPTCRKEIGERATKEASVPFCSARCKQVDLGKWLNEEYRLPASDEDDGTGDHEEA